MESRDCRLPGERSGAAPAARAERGDRIETGGDPAAPRGRRPPQAARYRRRPFPVACVLPSRPFSVVTLPPGRTSTVAPYWAEGRHASLRSSGWRRFWVIGAALLALAATSVAAMLFLQRRPAPAVLKFAVIQPENTSYPGMPSVSPDGRYLTFSAVGPEGKRMLWLRPLDALHATVIQGSEGASAPFWSPGQPGDRLLWRQVT